MKYKLIAAVLALEAINVKSGLFGGKSFASFTEEQLDAIEEALEKTDTTALNAQIAQLQKEVEEKNTRLRAIENSVTQALLMNELDVSETFSESIDALGEKCKEYGEKKAIHTSLTHNGKEVEVDDDGLIEGFIDPNAEHNKLLKKLQ